MNIYSIIGDRSETPQSEPIPGKEMVPNEAGGYGFKLDDWQRLERFLILGTEGGTYYTTERELTRASLGHIEKLIGVDGPRVVETTVSVSLSGRAPRNTPSIWTLAACSVLGDEETKKRANVTLADVCRTGTHLFGWASALRALNGHGPSGAGQRRALAHWYTNRTPESLAYQMLKYRQREGWTHRDLLRLCKPGAAQVSSRNANPSPVHSDILAWVVGKPPRIRIRANDGFGDVGLAQIAAFDKIHQDLEIGPACDLITGHRLTREMMPSELLSSPKIWAALLQEMPMGAMVRNLGKMTAVGLLKPLSDAETIVVSRLSRMDLIRKARLHPVSILNAAVVYARGHGVLGKLNWEPLPRITEALNKAFCGAFSTVEPSGQRLYLAIDASGSMGTPCAGFEALSCCQGAAAMAMATARTEERYYIQGFHSHRVDVGIHAGTSLGDAMARLRSGYMTDASIPMRDAMDRGLEVDTFIIYTDCETWSGKKHPVQALRAYRDKVGRPVKLICVSMAVGGSAGRASTTICDPEDGLQLDVVGFDANGPAVVADFCREGPAADTATAQASGPRT